jgi:hypothetical protein
MKGLLDVIFSGKSEKGEVSELAGVLTGRSEK